MISQRISVTLLFLQSCMVSANEGPIAIPQELGKPVELQEYLNLALQKSLQRKSADVALENAGYTHELYNDNYLPRPTVSASQTTSGSSTHDSRSVSRSQSTGLSWSGQSPYGISWGLTAPQLSKTRSETGGDFQSLAINHNAKMSANVSINLLKDSYFIVGTRKDTRADLTYKNAMLSHRNSLLEIVKNAQTKFFDLIFQYTSLQVQRDAVKDAKTLFENNQVKLKEGEVDKLAVLQTRLQVAKAEDSLISAEESFQNSFEQFIQIIDPDREGKDRVFPDPSILERVPKRPSISIREAVEQAKKYQPQYNISRNNFLLQKISLTESRSALWPSLQLTSDYGWSGSDQGAWEALAKARRGENKSVTVGLSFSYVPWNNPATTSFKSAKNSYQTAKNDFEQTQNQLVTNLTQQLKTVENAYRKLESSNLSLELSRQKLEAEKFKYNEGVTTIKDVIDFQKEYEAARIAVMQARSQVFIAITNLRATLGVPHEKLGQLEFEKKGSKSDD